MCCNNSSLPPQPVRGNLRSRNKKQKRREKKILPAFPAGKLAHSLQFFPHPS
jgi:hypothetical protein